MKRSLQLSVAVVLTLSLVGCFNGSGSSGSNQASQVDFTDFVKAEIDNTADDREPVKINNVEFTFNDQDNEQAFDELF